LKSASLAVSPRPGSRCAGRVAIITGATSGIGLAIATDLARRGGTVHLLARDPGRAECARQDILARSGAGDVTYGIADMCEPAAIRRFAGEFAAGHDRLDVLVHNAGAMYRSRAENSDGIELTFAGQVAGPYLLTTLLLPALAAAAPARVIVVSSGGMYAQPLSRSLAPVPAAGYRASAAYARAKRAQVALSGEWARRVPADVVAFHAMHPGWVDTPGIAAALPGFHRIAGRALRSPEQGADTAVWLATADAEALGSGRFWHDRRPRREHLAGRSPRGAAGAAGNLWDSLAAQADAVRQ
jgi:dehydrogenase/reductase SDR family member 12